MTTVYTEQSNEIRKILKNKYNVDIVGGQDHLAGKIFRINHMGLVEDFEAAWAVNATELVLDELGIRTFDGTANRVLQSHSIKENSLMIFEHEIPKGSRLYFGKLKKLKRKFENSVWKF